MLLREPRTGRCRSGRRPWWCSCPGRPAFAYPGRAARDRPLAASLTPPGFTHLSPDGPAPYFGAYAAGRPGATLQQWAAPLARAPWAEAPKWKGPMVDMCRPLSGS